jgi:hypothetical protein
MWNKLPIEAEMEALLECQFGKDKAGEYIGHYTEARTYVINEITGEIKGSEPSLSDHSSKHIADVLERVGLVLGNDVKKLTGVEVYCLCLIVLFHDVGNIAGRTGHNKKIAEIYNRVRANKPKFNQERQIVIQAAQAHCGISRSGSRDTLKEVEIVSNLDGHPVRLRDMASILRFADELAEGPQRTSEFMSQTGKYPKESQIYHDYANITNVFIDPGGERIALTFHIDIASKSEEEFQKLLEFTYSRVIKLDEERRYTKHYSEFLYRFKKTDVKINFYEDGISCDFDLPRIELLDQFPIPGETEPDINELLKKYPNYDVNTIYQCLKSQNNVSAD